jgi:hypothetical protein
MRLMDRCRGGDGWMEGLVGLVVVAVVDDDVNVDFDFA